MEVSFISQARLQGHVGKGQIGQGLPPFQNESRCAFISATYHGSDYDFNGQKIP